jgi:hypothetical protein
MKRENCNCCPQVLYMVSFVVREILIPGPNPKFQVIPYPNPAPDPTFKKGQEWKLQFFLAEQAEAGLFKHLTNPDL